MHCEQRIYTFCPPNYRFFNSLRPRQNGRHFASDIFKCIFLNENVCISIRISLKFVPKGPINNIPALVQIMAWCRSGDKPLSEAMMVNLPTNIFVSRPQWVVGWLIAKLWQNSLIFLWRTDRCDTVRFVYILYLDYVLLLFVLIMTLADRGICHHPSPCCATGTGVINNQGNLQAATLYRRSGCVCGKCKRKSLGGTLSHGDQIQVLAI